MQRKKRSVGKSSWRLGAGKRIAGGRKPSWRKDAKNVRGGRLSWKQGDVRLSDRDRRMN
jgi:hypothetical protein